LNLYLKDGDIFEEVGQ